MYSVGVSDHIMIAHSLPHPVFGPAQGLHGATYVVDVSFARRELDDRNIVVDIDAASEQLRGVLDGLRYRNLDDHPDFAGQLTTTEAIAHHIAGRLADSPLIQGLSAMEVTLRETPNAWASYRMDFDADI